MHILNIHFFNVNLYAFFSKLVLLGLFINNLFFRFGSAFVSLPIDVLCTLQDVTDVKV